MDLGTGKDLEEYGDVSYHLIDVCKAGERYNLHRFVRDFHKVYPELKERGILPVFLWRFGHVCRDSVKRRGLA